MADQEPSRPPPRASRNTPPPVNTKLSRTAMRILAAMDDPVQVEKSRKTLEECRRDYDNEQKLLEDADREKAEGSARAVSRNDEAASKAKEVVIDKEEDIDHGRNDEPTETERTNTATAPTTDVITYQCMECFLDDTVPSDKQNMRYPIEEFDKHLKSTYHSRPAQKMRASYLAEEPGTMPTEARCPLCGETWSSEEFIQHLADQHPEQWET
jgi:hypothetical protein